MVYKMFPSPLWGGLGRGLAGFAVMIMFLSFAYATSPSQMNLSYDQDKGILHIEAHHPSDNMNTHYLRRLVLYQNGTQIKEIFYFKQNAPVKFIENIPIIAKEGNVLAVEVFCVKGGSKRAEITIPTATPDTAATPPKPAKTPASAPKNTY